MKDLEAQFRQIGEGFSGRWTLALTDLATGDHIAIDEDEEMPAASVIKVPTLAALYRAADEGDLSLDDRIIFQERHRFPGTGVLAHMSPGIGMSVRDAAVLMVVVSDNAAFNMLVDLLGLERINSTTARLGLTGTKLKLRLGDLRPGPDGRFFAVTTAADACRLMELIARREAVSPAASDDMLDILRRQQSRDKLSRNLPWDPLFRLPGHPDSWVASKDGINAYRGVRADAAIMRGPRGFFAMAVFTEDADYADQGVDCEGNLLLARFGRAAWDCVVA